jgi:hypothetical protein
LALVGLTATGVLAGAALGAVTNFFNGWLSPAYFRNILGWHDVADEVLRRAVVAQGILEGLGLGLFLSLVLVVVAGVVSRARCSYGFGTAILLAVAAGTLACWALGGLVGMGLATLSSEFYRHTFRGAPADPRELLPYAWVGGSIAGSELGGLALTVLGSFLFYARWRRRMWAA